MRHNVSGRKLNRSPSHRRMLYRNLVTSLFRYERIQTTIPKAKEARSLAERLITFAKAGDLNSRRQAAKKINDPAVLKKLFEEIGPRYSERPGGYTRILRLSGVRRGDSAEVAILELVDSKAKPKVQDSKKRRRQRRILKIEEKAAEAAPAAAAADVAETAAAEDDTEAAAADAATTEPENGDQENADQGASDEKGDKS
jgi:large subunit ribosomal protein L17